MNKHTDTRLFEDVVKAIENAELDVDAVLKAARLTRNPKNRINMDAGDIALIIVVSAFALLILGVIGSLLFSIGR